MASAAAARVMVLARYRVLFRRKLNPSRGAELLATAPGVDSNGRRHQTVLIARGKPKLSRTHGRTRAFRVEACPRGPRSCTLRAGRRVGPRPRRRWRMKQGTIGLIMAAGLAASSITKSAAASYCTETSVATLTSAPYT